MRFGRNRENGSFFELLTQIAGNLIEGTDYLSKILQASAKDREGLRNELHAVENSSDDLTHGFMNQVNQTFVTPLDRDDLALLASNLDDIMDMTDEAGNLIVVYKLEDLPEGVAGQVDILQKCARLTAEAMPNLRLLEGLREYWVEINRLENQADQIYMRTLMSIFDEVTDPIQIIKLKDIIEALERSVDAYETLASTIESIAIKES